MMWELTPQADRLFEIERDFYGSFSGIHRGEGYKAYHRMEYADLTDCNHAVLDLSNRYFRRPDILENTLDEMASFYEFIGLTPRLYQGFYEDEYKLLVPHLQARGYVMEAFEETELYLFHPAAFEEDRAHQGDHKKVRLSELTAPEELEPQLFLDVDGHLGWYAILSEMLQNAKHRLFAIKEEEGLVALASVQSLGQFCRIDHVKTLKSHRGQGYCRSLMQGMLSQLLMESPETLYYLYASNPEAIRPYTKSGFRKMENSRHLWGAWRHE